MTDGRKDDRKDGAALLSKSSLTEESAKTKTARGLSRHPYGHPGKAHKTAQIDTLSKESLPLALVASAGIC